jgi:hypothetical protein
MSIATIKGVKCIHASDKAIRVRFPDGRRVWVPQSAICDESEVWKMDDFGKLVVKEWFSEQLGVELD